jgi:hypothetical protein
MPAKRSSTACPHCGDPKGFSKSKKPKAAPKRKPRAHSFTSFLKGEGWELYWWEGKVQKHRAFKKHSDLTAFEMKLMGRSPKDIRDAVKQQRRIEAGDHDYGAFVFKKPEGHYHVEFVKNETIEHDRYYSVRSEAFAAKKQWEEKHTVLGDSSRPSPIARVEDGTVSWFRKALSKVRGR